MSVTSFNWRKNIISKKVFRYSMHIPRQGLNLFSNLYLGDQSPIVIANSFPKSGTHLLIQVLQVLPDVRDWGLFLASTPSLTFREITSEAMASKVDRIVDRELIGAHIFYSEIVKKALEKKKKVHFFVYRDIRDVVISESFYLHKMNRWHRLHKYFKSFSTDDERIMFSITGSKNPDFPYDYPNVAKRFERYEGWLKQKDVFAVKFEDLVSDKRQFIIREMMEFYNKKAEGTLDPDILTEKALQNIDPKRSHTFRQGKTGQWRNVFNKHHKKVFKEVAGKLLIDLDYEKDYSW